MGKGGAPTTTNTVQNQNVAYTPTGLQGFQDIYARASQVASQPYQPYTGQLVEGLNPTQTGAINQISNIAGSPLSAGQIQQYMNPFQSDVINATMANINETNRQQQAQTTGQLTNAAGGIGASRIALGQGELARQQALASNQTLAGLNQQNYAQALGAAQQQQGFGLGAAQSQLQAGTLAQQTGQAGKTAAYQQYLQQLAFPYQQVQFLAGVGLPSLGAMGGQQYQTGTAGQVVTPPGLSWAQGLAGAGALGYGLYQGGAFNGWGGGGGSFTGSGDGSARGGRIGYASGGDVDDDSYPHFGDQQDTSDHERDHDDALAPVLSDKGYVPDASSPKSDEKMPTPIQPIQQQTSGGSGGSGASTLGTIGAIAGTAAKIIPLFLKDGGYVPAHYDDGGMVPMQQGSMGMGSNAYPSPSMYGQPLTRGALPQSAQMSSPNVFYGRPLPNMLPAYPAVKPQDPNQSVYEAARQVLQQQQLGQALASIRGQSRPEVSVSAQEYARGGYAEGGFPNIADWDDDISPSSKIEDRFDLGTPYVPPFERGDNENFAPRMALPSPKDPLTGPFDWRHPNDLPPSQANPYDTAAGAVNRRFNYDMDAGIADIDRSPLKRALTYEDVNRVTKGDLPPINYSQPDQGPKSVPAFAVRKPDEIPTDYSGDRADPYPRMGGGTFDPGTASPRDIMNLQNYKDQVAQRPTVMGLTKNPDFWIRAGLGILAANPAKGPLGAIASGALGTVGEYDQWSKDDLNSKQKAMELAAKLKEHSDKYTKTTAAEKERFEIEREKLQQGKWQAFNYTDKDGNIKAGFMDTRTRQIVDGAGRPIQDLGRIYSRSSQSPNHEMTANQITRAIEAYYKDHPMDVDKPREEVAQIIAHDPVLYKKYVADQQSTPYGNRPSGVPADAGFSPGNKHWFSRDGHEWDETGKQIK